MVCVDHFKECVGEGVDPRIAYAGICISIARNGTMEQLQALTKEYEKTVGRGSYETTETENISA